MEIPEENLSAENLKECISTKFSQSLEKYKFTSAMLKVILEISANLHAASTFHEVGRLLFEGLERLGYAEDSGCKLGVYFEEEDSFEIVFFKHRHKATSYFVFKSKLKDLKMFTKLAIERKETILIRDSYSEYALSIDPNLMKMSKRTMIFIPLFHKEKLVGLFSYARAGVDSITEELKHFLECISKIVSIVIAELLGEIKREEYEKEINEYREKYEQLNNNTCIENIHNDQIEQYIFEGMVSINPKMEEIFKRVTQIAQSDSTVLIEGETGTGKELLAKAIHKFSNRCNKPYVIINCTTLPENLAESELFGHTKGAFTDAWRDKKGKIGEAECGTVFFDEISELPLNVQSKLLRLFENKEYQPLGNGAIAIKSDIRVIAATNKDLKLLVKEGKFREDLYHRINVVQLHLPPLKERKDDIPLLIYHFISNFNKITGKNIEGISDKAKKILLKHDYTGNIRELKNFIEHAYNYCNDKIIQKEHLPDEVLNTGKTIKSISDKNKITEEEYEKKIISDALKRNKGNKTKTYKELKISRTTL
jgi:transcriptional regulator with PAS, ATPase and Fis domain